VKIALREIALPSDPVSARSIGLSVVVIRAFPRGRFEIDYSSPTTMPRVHVRALLERMQDEFDAVGEPLRAYLFRDGIPIEAAHCLRSHRS
jgi:hypothetical protein